MGTLSGKNLTAAIRAPFSKSFLGIDPAHSGWRSSYDNGYAVTYQKADGSADVPLFTLNALNLFEIQSDLYRKAGSHFGINTQDSVLGGSTVRINSRTFTNVAVAVTGATNANPIVITTAAPHGLATGMKVTITGVVGNTNANVTANLITVVTATTFSLTGISGNDDYTSGGTVTRVDVTVIGFQCKPTSGISISNSIEGGEISPRVLDGKSAGYLVGVVIEPVQKGTTGGIVNDVQGQQLNFSDEGGTARTIGGDVVGSRYYLQLATTITGDVAVMRVEESGATNHWGFLAKLPDNAVMAKSTGTVSSQAGWVRMKVGAVTGYVPLYASVA